ncbi:MAG: hypothetical protein JXA25_12385 [Anaerolineales bacterium]|nr:hypothetical protein [Anaerolineales bacterium]
MNTTERWNKTPGYSAGILCMQSVVNSTPSAALESYSLELAEELLARYEGLDRPQLREIPELAAYHQFYKQFRKSYHVQLQLESVIFKKKPIRGPSPLVQAMFLAELKNHLLTSAHDLDLVQEPLTIAVADGSEHFLRINNEPQTLKDGDLYIFDTEEILSSVIYGPDFRTRIQKHTCRVLFTVYGVPGISINSIQHHLEDLRDLVLLSSPSAVVEKLEVIQSEQG